MIAAPTSAEVTQALELAADYIEEHGWTRRELESQDGRVCLLGAINKAAPYDDRIYAHTRLRRYLQHTLFPDGYRWLGITEYNDDICPDKAGAVQALRAAAAWELGVIQ